MQTHVSDEGLMDVLDGAGSPMAAEHLRSCAACRGRLEEARGGMSLAREAEVPEPSPLYWESFEGHVGRRLARGPSRRWILWPAAAALAAALAFVVLRPTQPPAPVAPVAVLPEWSPLPPGEDAGLRVLQSVADDLAPEAECAGLEECVADLSDDEVGALAEMLRREVPGRAS